MSDNDSPFQQAVLSRFRQCFGRLEGRMGKDYSEIENELKILFLDGVDFGLEREAAHAASAFGTICADAIPPKTPKTPKTS